MSFEEIPYHLRSRNDILGWPAVADAFNCVQFHRAALLAGAVARAGKDRPLFDLRGIGAPVQAGPGGNTLFHRREGLPGPLDHAASGIRNHVVGQPMEIDHGHRLGWLAGIGDQHTRHGRYGCEGIRHFTGEPVGQQGAVGEAGGIDLFRVDLCQRADIANDLADKGLIVDVVLDGIPAAAGRVPGLAAAGTAAVRINNNKAAFVGNIVKPAGLLDQAGSFGVAVKDKHQGGGLPGRQAGRYVENVGALHALNVKGAL